MSTHGITIALAIGFGLSELALSQRKRSTASAARMDRGSLHLLWVVIMTAWVLAFSLADAVPVGRFRVDPALFAIALLIFSAGIALRWFAIVQLGRLFTVDVSIAADHRLIDSGPYHFIRHPSYAGALMAFLGLGLAMGSLPGLAALMVPSVAAYLYRISVEEAALRHAFGISYVDYARRTYRLIPGVY